MIEQEMKMKYLGVLGLLCEASVYVPEDVRECMENALQDAVDNLPNLRWKRILDRLDIEVVT